MFSHKRKQHPTKFRVVRKGVIEELTSEFIHEGRLWVTKILEEDHSRLNDRQMLKHFHDWIVSHMGKSWQRAPKG